MLDNWPTLKDSLKSSRMQELKGFLRGQKYMPKNVDVFKAYELCPPDKTQLVWVGMDPYPNPKNRPDGLAFSSPYMTASLMKINEALEKQGENKLQDTKLDYLARQGVLLLNAVLTVVPHQPGSHHGKGWEQFVAQSLSHLYFLPSPICFMLWGKSAKSLGKGMVSQGNKLVLTSEHPANAARENRTWMCDHFTKYRKFEEDHNLNKIKF